MMKRADNATVRRNSSGNASSPRQVIERRRRRAQQCRQILPPDFIHGEVAVGEIYEVFGGPWARRVLFVVDDPEVVSVAYFDDYFLVVEQWTPDDGVSWSQWWERRRDGHSRIVALRTEGHHHLDDEVTVPIEIERKRLEELERGVLGVARDAVGTAAGGGRRCRSEIDVLSLVTLTSRLTDGVV